jgi:hypothetical protein
MPDMKKELLDVVGQAYDVRLKPRLEGLTDEEYFWEPVPDCWTVHRNDDGTYRADWGFIFDEIPPFTTIAWRMRHLIDCYGSRRAAIWLGLEERPNPLERGTPGTASDAVNMLAEAHEIFVGYIDAISEDALLTQIGPVGGQYAEYTKLSLLLHQIDEIVHHGAEVSLLRDLYRAQRRDEDPFVLACFSADRAAVEDMRRQDAGIVDRMRAEHPDLMLRAAETGRWDAIPLLVELGFPVDGPNGRGPVHHTAGTGNMELTRLLVDAGADLEAKDPMYQSTPLGWAEWFHQSEVVEFLRDTTASAHA